MKIFKYLFFFLFPSLNIFSSFAQPLTGKLNLDYTHPAEYIIGGITVTGIQNLDPEALVAISGLKVGDKITIPGDDISTAIKKLWDHGLVGDVQVSASKVEGSEIFLNFYLRERPRLSKFVFKGVKKSEQDDLKGKIDNARGTIVNDALIKNSSKKIKNYYLEKGFLNTEVKISKLNDTLLGNNIILKIEVSKHHKIRIHKIEIEGNSAFSDKKLKKKMKKTKEKKWYNPLVSSKIITKEYEADKQKIIDLYNSEGYRDAKIIFDTIYSYNEKSVNVSLKIEEGPKYFIRDITWTGNYIYPDSTLNQILNIKKGSVYSSELLQKRLNYNPNGLDISSLYLDNGYLFFSVDQAEVVEGDSVDIEMRIFEGTQATIDQVTVSGNTKTHDHVILREIYTIPGQKFNRTDLIRSQMTIAQMGYFDTDQIGINPVPNPQKGTVDINYTVAEKPSDQIELSGGWGGNFGFIGTVGLVFNNFSLKKLDNFKEWSPLPAGDGQRLALRFQASGRQFQTLSLSFTEPWLGGKKPNSLTTSVSQSRQNIIGRDGKSTGHLWVSGVSVGLGRRLLKFSDNFTLQQSLSYYRYSLKNFPSALGFPGGTGNANNISFTTTLSRYHIPDLQKNNPAFPLSGSSIDFTLTVTPPYSVLGKLDPANPYKFVEFHKWSSNNSWFITLIPGKDRSLVLNARAHFGFIGKYKNSTPIGPFERYKLGGSGLSGFNFLLASDVVGLRGYPDNSIFPIDANGQTVTSGGIIFDKFVFELRYPIHLSSSFSVFTEAFLEGGNSWGNFKDFNPFNIYRAAGMGLRLQMPAFGMIGLDYGWPLDTLPGRTQRKGQFTFTIGQQIR